MTSVKYFPGSLNKLSGAVEEQRVVGESQEGRKHRGRRFCFRFPLIGWRYETSITADTSFFSDILISAVLHIMQLHNYCHFLLLSIPSEMSRSVLLSK